MKKIIATKFVKHPRYPLREIYNLKVDPGRVAALDYNKGLLVKAKEQLAIKDSKLVEAEQEIAQLRAMLAAMQGNK